MLPPRPLSREGRAAVTLGFRPAPSLLRLLPRPAGLCAEEVLGSGRAASSWHRTGPSRRGPHGRCGPGLTSPSGGGGLRSRASPGFPRAGSAELQSSRGSPLALNKWASPGLPGSQTRSPHQCLAIWGEAVTGLNLEGVSVLSWRPSCLTYQTQDQTPAARPRGVCEGAARADALSQR